MNGWESVKSSKSRFGRHSHISSDDRMLLQRRWLGGVQRKAPGDRIIYCNDRDANLSAHFKGNSISTTKYNFFTFIPKGLFEQFRRSANLYSLVTSVLSAMPFSPVRLVTNMAPLSFVLLVSLCKEAFEDWKRFQDDMKMNNTPVDVLQDQRWESIPWKKLQVGDIVKVEKDGRFPADLLFLASTNADGVCYTETAKLDGETNLKIWKAVERTWDYITPEKASEFKGKVQCEHPNNSLYTFTGNLIHQEQTLPVTPNQILLRGCSLKNTEYIVGAVIFTGHETKVFAANMLTYVTLFSSIVPMFLYFCFEVIKAIQSSQFIHKDLRMYHAKTDTPAIVRTSNLNEELGQVEYIFSDKTGTLTRNRMEFFKCSIGGEVYGTGMTEIETGGAQRTGKRAERPKPANEGHEKGFNFDDTRLMRGAWRNEPNPDMCKEFFRCLATCHTVLPEGDESPEKITYEAASPDEGALVIAAKNFGFFFYRRTPTVIYVRESHVEKMGKIDDVKYEICNVLEFNSTRKRQSVVCRYPNGRLVLYCKGADSVIYERLGQGQDDLKRITRENLLQFGSAGLRTLCLAYRDLSPEIYNRWYEKFTEANGSLRDHEKKLNEVAELIEKELILIGCTAIEDRLQEGVPNCIETLSKAGIKIWLLTGDKMETAINIAYACKLIINDMKQFIISSETDMIRELEERGDKVELERVMKEEVKKQLDKSLEEAQLLFRTVSGPKLVLVIDGRCLTYALKRDLRTKLLNLSINCTSVVCCRVAPLQKAQVTNLVKKGARKITLSIGDGANDVSMIRAAHVGVGISGLEGMQAVMASDYAIAQFRFLSDLFLVHGRWSYLRMCQVVTYFLHKSLAFTLTQFWFAFQDGFSGQRFYNDWFPAGYNYAFTFLPVFIFGLFEKDVSRSLSKKYPQLYKEGIRNSYLKGRVVAAWALSAVYQSLVFYHFVTASSSTGLNSSGKMFGLWDISTVACTCVVVTVNLRVLLMCNSITRWQHIAISLSILAWFVFVFICSLIKENLYHVIHKIMSTVYFYLAFLLVPIVALLGDFLWRGVQRWFFPYDYQIIQEIHRHEPDDYTGAMGLEIRNQLTTDQERSFAISLLPRETSKYTGFAFDSPGYESFFASQHGVYAPQKAWDVIRRASMRTKPRTLTRK